MKATNFMVILGFAVFFGCIDGVAGAIDPNERTFEYDTGNIPESEIKRTMAIGTSEEPYAIYGTTTLTINQCLSMDKGLPRSRCINQAAAYLGDISICENLEPASKWICYNNYAVKTADPSACDLMGGIIQEVYGDDVAYNDYITASCKRQAAILAGDSSFCVSVPGEPSAEQKVDLCKEIADSEMLVGKEECRDEIVVHLLVESPYFGDTLLWLRENHPGEKVLSWWDYGKAIDCVGLESIISNEDIKTVEDDIFEVAYLFVEANESEVISFMEEKDADLLMLDAELVSSGNALGGKYGALNYLSCAYMNETDGSRLPGESNCEAEHLWEIAYAPTDLTDDDICIISDNKTGVVVYHVYLDDEIYTPYYPESCKGSSHEEYCREFVNMKPAYCMGAVVLEDGGETTGLYHLDQADKNGDLKLNKGFVFMPFDAGNTYHLGYATGFTVFYTKDEVWPENGTIVSGYEDRTTAFYDSIIYKSVFLDEVDGFEKVHDSSGYVKVFEMD